MIFLISLAIVALTGSALGSTQMASPPLNHAHLNNHLLQSRDGYGYGGYGGYQQSYYPVSSGYSFTGIGEIVLGVLATLAGLALLASILTAFATPFAVMSGRKRRDVAADPLGDVTALQGFLAAFEDVDSLPQRLMANYLSCSGLISDKNGSPCLERMACEVARPKSTSGQLEKKTMQVILSHLTSNQFLENEFKNRLIKAKNHKGDCEVFQCDQYFNNN